MVALGRRKTGPNDMPLSTTMCTTVSSQVDAKRPALSCAATAQATNCQGIAAWTERHPPPAVSVLKERESAPGLVGFFFVFFFLFSLLRELGESRRHHPDGFAFFGNFFLVQWRWQKWRASAPQILWTSPSLLFFFQYRF